MSEMLDCVVIGGGPAGLVAAIYLARYRRSSVVLSHGMSRASYIPSSRNAPGYPQGLRGPVLLRRLQQQADNHHVEILNRPVERVTEHAGSFEVHTQQESFRSRKIILATGVDDILPKSLVGQWEAVGRGTIRLCPICDAFESTTAPLFILGGEEKAGREALFLRGYSARLTLFTDGQPSKRWSSKLRALLRQADVFIEERKVLRIEAGTKRVTVEIQDGESQQARALYVALGAHVRSELATRLGARCDPEGYLQVDGKQQTSLRGFYAVGDVAQALSQISVAFGQAAIAATAIHNDLRELAYRTMTAQLSSRCKVPSLKQQERLGCWQ